MTHWARPGVKCVLVVEFSEYEREICENVPEMDVVYTIRDVLFAPRSSDGVHDIGVRLVEIVNPKGLYGKSFAEPGWVLTRFRPLITRTQEQDMELFTPLLDVRNHDELEREFQ